MQDKPLAAFGKQTRGLYGRRSQCNPCVMHHHMEWRKKNPEKWSALQKSWRDRCTKTPEYRAKVREKMRVKNLIPGVKKKRSEQTKARRQFDVVAARKKEKRSWLGRKYGISIDDYDRMLSAQNGKCGICLRKFEPLTKKRAWHTPVVDHDHVTGKVRALLCGPCNSGIGYFKDDIGRLEAAAKYLKRHLE